MAIYLFSRHKSRSGGGGGGRVPIAWRGGAESNGADLAYCPQIQE